MNYVFGVSFLVICVLAAWRVYHRAQVQVQFYTDIIAWLHDLDTQISFMMPAVPVMIQNHLTHYGNKLNLILQNYLQLLTAQKDVTYSACQQICTDVNLAEFLCQLGRAPQATERQKITNAVKLFTDCQTAARDYLTKKASITVKLLIIIGIAGVILWI